MPVYQQVSGSEQTLYSCIILCTNIEKYLHSDITSKLHYTLIV